MLRQLILFCFLTNLLFTGCKSETKNTTASCTAPGGKYVNTTVLNACPAKMPYDVPSFAYELNFNGKDSVTLDNGFESFTLPMSEAGNTCDYKLANASLHGDMMLKVTSDSTVELADTAWTQMPSFTTFKKLTNPANGFVHQLNDCLVSGSYAWFKDGNLVEGEVTLLPNGDVVGMKPYVRYVLCYAGDCLGETNPPSATIDLVDDQGKVETFSYKKVEGKMAIELYAIGEAQEDVKGERPIGKLVHELRSE